MLDEFVAPQPVEISELLRNNIRAARARAKLTQASVARRMNQLGYRWYPQTCGLVERNKRPLLADELAALALCLETSPVVLVLPSADVALVEFAEQVDTEGREDRKGPTVQGAVIPAHRLLSPLDDSVSWDGDDLKVAPSTIQYRPLELHLAREPDPQIRAGIMALADQLRRGEAGPLAPPQPGEQGAEDLPTGWQLPEPPDE